MKTLSIAPVVPAFRLKGRIRIMPIISVRKVLTRTVDVPMVTRQDRCSVLPTSNSLNYFMLTMTFLYIAILVTGCWAMVHIFLQWTTGSGLKGFPIS